MRPNILILTLMLVFGLGMGVLIFLGWRNARKQELRRRGNVRSGPGQRQQQPQQQAYDTSTGMAIPMTMLDSEDKRAANADSMRCDSTDDAHRSSSSSSSSSSADSSCNDSGASDSGSSDSGGSSSSD